MSDYNHPMHKKEIIDKQDKHEQVNYISKINTKDLGWYIRDEENRGMVRNVLRNLFDRVLRKYKRFDDAYISLEDIRLNSWEKSTIYARDKNWNKIEPSEMQDVLDEFYDKADIIIAIYQ